MKSLCVKVNKGQLMLKETCSFWRNICQRRSAFLRILPCSSHSSDPTRIQSPLLLSFTSFLSHPTGLDLFPTVFFWFLRPFSPVRCQGSTALSLCFKNFLILCLLERSFSNYLRYRTSFLVDQYFCKSKF